MPPSPRTSRPTRAAGFDAIGLWEFKLPEDDEANRALLRAHGLAVSNCVPSVPSFLQLAIPGLEGPADPEARIEAICASIRRLAAYDPGCVLCLSGPLGGRSRSRAATSSWTGSAVPRRRPARQEFTSASSRSTRRSTKPRVSSRRSPTRSSCSTKPARTTPGSWPIRSTSATKADEAVVRASARFTGLHVADELPEPTPGVRGLPGPEGRSAEIVAALRANGWDGTLDVEIFSTPDHFWALPPDEAARRAYAAASALV